MDRPPGGWSDLVTNQTLDLKIDVLRHELRTEMSDLRVEMANLSASVDRRLRTQTWMMMTTMIAAVGSVGHRSVGSDAAAVSAALRRGSRWRG